MEDLIDFLVCAVSGAKLKRERTEQDDLFCEEKMLIIDGEWILVEGEKDLLELRSVARGRFGFMFQRGSTRVHGVCAYVFAAKRAACIFNYKFRASANRFFFFVP